MPYGSPNTIDAWLQRNLREKDLAYSASLLAPSANGYRLRVLRLMLAFAALATAAIWYQEEHLELINLLNRFAYPVLLAVTGLGALLLVVRPGSLQAVLSTVFVTYVAYLLADYYYILADTLLAGSTSSYELASLAQWLPLGYVASFVFYSPRVAVRTSLGIYLAISLPQWGLLLSNTEMDGQQLISVMLISHPVYIAALWGVAQLKTHARGVQSLAKSMSVAATVDPLTGVANRRAMLHALQTVTGVLSNSGRPMALLLFDVDRFKGINDNFGHAAGDEVLITLSHRANAYLRASDLLGRWGGEEFIILALDQDESQALQMAERLRAELETIVYPQVGTVTVSIGVTAYIPGESIELFIKRADDALYQAKERGRNRVEGLFGRAAGTAG
ncbi:MAG TPA: GGDEF domain-containing protein [Gammaproteobacteria bacterium]